MKSKNYIEKITGTRRKFIKSSGTLATGLLLAKPIFSLGSSKTMGMSISEPAILGGQPIRTTEWPKWPMWDAATDEELVLKVLRSGVWSRANVVSEFEQKWAETIGSKRCLAVVNGTNAMIASMVQLGIGGGDEVLVSAYTFIASAAAILATGAKPVFVDVDPETFQIDPDKIESKITSKTRAIMPVHILGMPADMPRIMKIARKHNLIVVEDACQAWLAEIDHKKMGTFGDAGCFSFQNSKNIPIGEGGAIVSDNDEFMDRCYSYHNYGNPYGTTVGKFNAGTVMAGTKLRITEYQAAIGLAQLKRLESQTLIRSANAGYLKSKIDDIPGISTYKLYPNVTRAVFHIFAFKYNKELFGGLSRAKFIDALIAEGIPCFGGYQAINKMPYLEHAFNTKNFKKMYSPEELNIDKYLEENRCPNSERLCDEEAVWLTQNMLLGEKQDMDDVVNAIEKIRQNADKIKSSN